MSEIAEMRPKEPDWETVTPEELAVYQMAENRLRASAEARVITGAPEPGAAIEWESVAFPDRAVPVRVYRPDSGEVLPAVIHVHGGGIVGTAAQSDWINSHLAVHLPAVVISVEHRLLDWQTPLSAAADDGWDVLRHVVENAPTWGVDPTRVALFGESFGGLINTLSALRARHEGVDVRAQVLVNPVLDLTSSAWSYDSVTEFSAGPTLPLSLLRFVQQLSVPSGADPRALSPLHADDVGGLAPALVVLPTADPLADHGRVFATRLADAGTPVQVSEYRGLVHAFLSMPGAFAQAEAARTEILEHLKAHLAH